MIENILIPTDFTIESLNILKVVLNNNNGSTKYNVILVHGTETTDSITEFLFFSKSKFINSISNIEFDEACEVIKNKYASSINSLRKDVFTGFTQNAFNNYIEANKVSTVFIPENFSFKMASKKSFDILPFLEKCEVEVKGISFETNPSHHEKGNLSEVFSNAYN